MWVEKRCCKIVIDSVNIVCVERDVGVGCFGNEFHLEPYTGIQSEQCSD